MQCEQEHDLREAAACGDSKKVEELLSANGSLVNLKHSINGWTALHWAAKRNHLAVVDMLMNAGADKAIQNSDGRTAAELTTDTDVSNILVLSDTTHSLQQSVQNINSDSGDTSGSKFVPSYLQNHTLPSYYGKSEPRRSNKVQPVSYSVPNVNSTPKVSSGELVLKVRIAHGSDEDFIEIELDNSQRTFSSLINLVCTELRVCPQNVVKVRKLPNTIIRKDKDVCRLTDFQEIEIVVNNSENANSYLSEGNDIGQYSRNNSVLY